MTEEMKPKRGRPTGSGYDDTPIMQHMAAILIKEPTMPIAKAIRRCGEDSESVIHRIRRKWKRCGSTYLAQAEERARPKVSRMPNHAGLSRMADASQMWKDITRASDAFNGPLKQAQELLDNPLKREIDMLREIDMVYGSAGTNPLNDPLWKQAEELLNNPIRKQVEEFLNDPVRKQAEELLNSAILGYANEFSLRMEDFADYLQRW